MKRILLSHVSLIQAIDTRHVEVVSTRAAHTFGSDQYEHPQMCGPDLILIEEMHENKTKS